MTFTDIPAGAAIFVDANTLVYHFAQHPVFGAACTPLMTRIENQEIDGITSAAVLGEMAHRLMTIEAGTLFGWPAQGMASQLRRHPGHVQQLNLYRRAIDETALLGIRVLETTRHLVSLAADVSQQFG